MKSTLHQAALDWAAAGFFIFPCRVGRKEPACPHGHEDATRDPAVIDAWWTENPFNIGCAPDASGNSVLDADPPLGLETLETLGSSFGELPKTLTISTPRGGLHLWYDGELPSTASKLGPKLDTRGVGGYVLLPPSVIAPGEYKNNPTGGSYAVKENNIIPAIPAWVQEILASARQRTLAATRDLDTPDAIGRVRETLKRLVAAGDVAIEGCGGNYRTFLLCCAILDLGVSIDTGLVLIGELWNPHCEPPWSDDELRTLFDNAAKYRQNEIGCYAVGDPAKEFASLIEVHLGDGAEPAARRSRFYPLDLTEQSEQAEPEWLIPGLIPAQGQILVYGQKKSFKTFLVLDLALGIAASEETFGFTPKMGAVVYAVGEGQANISRKHVPAWRIAKGKTETDFPFYVVSRVPHVINKEETYELVAQIKAKGINPAVVVVDTMARSIGGLEENSAKDVGTFVSACDYIRDQLQCTVVVVHHSGKDGSKGSRGSNALEGAFDTVLEVRRHEKTNTVALFVRDQRSAQEREEPYTFEGKQVGSSLVFQPTTAADYKAATEADQLVSSKKIGAALQRLNAYGYEHGVTTNVLAAELALGTDFDEGTMVKQIMKERRRQPKIALLADGEPLLWHLIAAPQ